MPQGDATIKTTISIEQKDKIPLSRAEQYLHMFLNLAGYVMYPTNGFFVIAPRTPNTEGREPYHLYVNMPPKELPKSSEMIRAIYYLNNFQVPQMGQAAGGRPDPLAAILKDMVGENKFFFDSKSNAIILYGPADKITSAMTIILELDAAGLPETVTSFPLFYASADIVANLIKSQIVATATKPGGGRLQVRGESGRYFTPNTRVVSDPRTNHLILIGSEPAVARIKSFVQEYIDVPLESGKSILHVYDLQYLDAKEFSEVLKNLVGQSKGQTQKEIKGGPQRFFEDVVITAEEEREVATKETTSSAPKTAGKIILGGNRLIVTAKHDDWLVIKELIEELDKPEPQAIIEIMVVDVTLDGIKNISAQTRNPIGANLHDNMEFQTAHISSQILDSNTNPTTLTADLLRLLGGTPNTSVAVPASSDTFAGSLIVSFKDPCKDSIWSILRILDKWTHTKVISHPFLVAQNNKPALASLKVVRRGDGREVASSGVTTIKVEDYPAVIQVAITPRISSLNRMSLQIRVDIEDFLSVLENTFNKTTRMVETNATMSPGQILVIGGLIKDNEQEAISKWPILGDIPIIGNFFKGTTKTKTKNNLAIFIHPTIVDPKLRSGQKRFTDDRVIKERQVISSELFASNKQPVTRMFFGDMRTRTGEEFLDDYLKGAHYKETHDENSYNPSEYLGTESPRMEGTEEKITRIAEEIDEEQKASALPQDLPELAKKMVAAPEEKRQSEFRIK